MKPVILNRSQGEEFNNIAKNQPVSAGYVISHDTVKDLVKLGLVMWYEDEAENISGYVLTKAGKEHEENNLKAVFEIVADGILYKPQGCRQSIGSYHKGCGKCGTGAIENCEYYTL